MLLNNAALTEDRELLLNRWLLFLSNTQLKQTCMNVTHVLEEIEREANMDGWTLNELIESIIIEFLDKMADEDPILVEFPIVSFLEVIHLNVE